MKHAVNKFSKDIKANAEEYYVSSAELVAKHLAERLSRFRSAVELCCMVGITTVQLAKKIPKVYAVDISSERIEKSKYNAELYNVSDRITFICGDVLDPEILKRISVEVAVIDPAWRLSGKDRYEFVNSMSQTDPDMEKVFRLTKKYITPNIVLRMPNNFTFDTLKGLGVCKIENLIWNDILRYKFAYFFPEIKENFEENIYFPEFIYSNKKEHYSPWNDQKHPKAMRILNKEKT